MFTSRKIGGDASGLILVGEEGPEIVDFENIPQKYLFLFRKRPWRDEIDKSKTKFELRVTIVPFIFSIIPILLGWLRLALARSDMICYDLMQNG